MYIIAAFFDTKDINKRFTLRGKYLEHFKKAFPEYEKDLKKAKAALGYFAVGDNAQELAYSLTLKSIETKENEIVIEFEIKKQSDIKSGHISDELRSLAKSRGWSGGDGLAPLLCLATPSDCDSLCGCARKLTETDAAMEKGNYKDVTNAFAPLGEVKDKPYWNSADILYRLGVACSKLSVTLKIKAGEKKKLDIAARYRDFCVMFLQRGAQLEEDARCASALAYRYYSNVHELTRPGERRDQNLEEQIEKANEWLSRSIEAYPQSVRNNYRKGKLIIEKQAPYLLYGKRAYGERETRLLREIREVGEEHLASAIAIYESLEDENLKRLSRREYAKALFVLGGYYLDDAYLPVHEYFLAKIASKDLKPIIKQISKLDLESAKENLEKCFYAETDMPLSRLDTAELAASVKKWARSPIEKLYRIGCAYGAMAFVQLAEGNADKAAALSKTSVYFLEAAKKVSDACTDKKRNTWHISEKIAWAYIYAGKFSRAAKLLERSRSGYIVNTYAIALLLEGGENNEFKAKDSLSAAAKDRRNLAAGLSRVLYAYTLQKAGERFEPGAELSSKNKKLAALLGLDAAGRQG